jgi:Leucine-rich repeat (LRR) protein
MPSLEILDISRNKIRKLPLTCGTLKNLKVRRGTVSKTGLTSSQVFSISKNRIKRLPPYFAQSERDPATQAVDSHARQ